MMSKKLRSNPHHARVSHDQEMSMIMVDRMQRVLGLELRRSVLRKPGNRE
jgi:hypothetical protein